MVDRRIARKLDFLLLGVIGALLAIGLLVMPSASNFIYPSQPLYFTEHQMLWILVGAVVAAVVMRIPYGRFRQYTAYIYALNIILLALVLIHGHAALGAQRWIGFGPVRLQPSEFAKIFIIVVLADYLEKRWGKIQRLRDLVGPLLYVAVPMLLIIKQPDLGTALVFVGILIGMLFMAGAPVRQLLLVFGGGFLAMVVWVALHMRFPKQVWIPMHGYQLNRLLTFINPGLDPTGSGYQILQSKVAIGSGGLLGHGIFHAGGRLTFLPEAWADFMFAAIGEDLGFLGAALVLFLFLALLWRGLRIATLAQDRFGALLAMGVVSLFTMHVLMNVGMAIGILPVVGVPLPFVSYGGSALLTDSLAVGILLNVYSRRQNLQF